jgi:hypothetical protein
MLQRVKHSLAFRSGSAYRMLLSALPISEGKAWPKKPPSELPFVTTCGRRHLGMLRETLHSVALFCSCYPRLRIYSDGSITSGVILDALRWWPGELQIPEVAAHEEWASVNGHFALLNYAKINGFGRKLLVVAGEAEKGVFCWFDTDILFYSDINALANKASTMSGSILASEDWLYGYDQKLISDSLAWMTEHRPVNTGFMRINNSFYTRYQLDELVAVATDTCNGFTEQTILAKVVNLSGGICWDLKDIPIFNHDVTSLSPTFHKEKLKCRHYITPIRHLFWRDAFALRVGFRP